jgi:LPPG:FO 2-phospho-L-lactate transferase
VHFQEYWVRLHAVPEALEVITVGAGTAKAAPGLGKAISAAELILVAPSNPVVSIGPILAVAPLRAALVAAPAPVIGFAGILGGAPVLGMAHRLLPAIGVEVDAGAVALHYGARSNGGVLDTWALHTTDAPAAAQLEAAGLRVQVDDLLMHDPEATARFVGAAVDGHRG